MSLAEKFVLRFDEFSSKHGKNITENVFKVTKMKDMYYTGIKKVSKIKILLPLKFVFFRELR